MEVYVDDDSKLTLHGLQQHYVKLKDNEKNRKLFELLDLLEFNQVKITMYVVFHVFMFKHQFVNSETKVSHWCITGDHLREVCPKMYGACTVACGAEFPCHRHTQSNDTGGKVCYYSIDNQRVRRCEKSQQAGLL